MERQLRKVSLARMKDGAIGVGEALGVARFLAIAVLIIYFPALVAIAAAVALTSDGPAFVSRVYRRRNGRTVDLWEFRTECWTRWELTPVGRYLRSTSLHRLPALVNVIRGDVRMGERVLPASEWHG